MQLYYLAQHLSSRSGAPRFTNATDGAPPFDPATYLGVAVGILGLALVAAWQPARRAAGVDPAVALREE